MPDRQELAASLAAARSEDTIRGLVFNALFTVVREAAGDEAARAADPVGKGSRIDFFAYPVADFLRLSWAAAERIAPKVGGVEEALFRIGHRAGMLVLDSMLGKTMLALASSGGVRQLLASIPGAYKGTVSWGERRVQLVDERHARAVFRGELLAPGFHRGVLTAVLERAGARHVRVDGRETRPLESEYVLAWEDAG